MSRAAVVGAVNMDICGKPFSPLLMRDSNPGTITLSPGGVGRNIAHNLCLLGQQTAMVTVMGDDDFGRRVQENAKDIGLDLAPAPCCRTAAPAPICTSPAPTGTWPWLSTTWPSMTA